jgi:glyoxylase-like metal-dependent hydrolase (beta-lactamase superfamily II)
LSLVFCLICISAFAQYEIKTEKISERVLVVKLINQYGALNVTAITTEKGIVVIDTAWPPAATREIRGTIEKELERGDFSYLINTHGHTDHASGNQVFKDAVIIGHENIFDAMNSTEKRKIQLNLGDDYVKTPPDVTFNDRLELDMGDISLELIYFGMAHSGADILIYIPEEKLLMVGDTFDYNFLPYISEEGNYDIARWITVLEYFLYEAPGVETVIGGHRETFDGKLLSGYLDYLKELWNGVDKAVKEGLSLEEAKQKLLKSISRVAFSHLKSTDEDYERNIIGVWKIMSKRAK